MYCNNVEADRDLTDSEKDLLRALMQIGKPEAYRFIPQIEDVRVKIECDCGCGRIYFVTERSDDVMILASRKFDRDDGGTFVYFVLSVGETLAGLESISYNRFGEIEEYPEDALFRSLGK